MLKQRKNQEEAYNLLYFLFNVCMFHMFCVSYPNVHVLKPDWSWAHAWAHLHTDCECNEAVPHFQTVNKSDVLFVVSGVS